MPWGGRRRRSCPWPPWRSSSRRSRNSRLAHRSGHPHHDGNAGELGEEPIAVPDGAPIVQEDLQRAPHGDPAHDVEPLVHDLGPQTVADGEGELTQENAYEEENEGDHEGDGPSRKKNLSRRRVSFI